MAGALTQSRGLGGRSRRETSEAERARQSVTKAIKQAVARIAKHDPELAESLGRSVQTGLFCRYEPALSSGLTWQT
jgi:non-specific serine/threonine protein kinase